MAQYRRAGLRRPQAVALIALSVALALLIGGCSQREDTGFGAPRGKLGPRPPAAARPVNCDRDASGQPVHFPAAADPARCLWRTTASHLAQVGGALVLWSSNGTSFTLRAIDVDNGGELWTTASVPLGDDRSPGDYESLVGPNSPLLVLRNSDAAYVAVVTTKHSRATALQNEGVNTVVRFYPVNGRGTLQPKVYTAPRGDFAPYSAAGQAGDRVLLRKPGISGEPDEYLVVNPAGADGKPFFSRGEFLPGAKETPAAVSQSGDVIVSFQEHRQSVVTDRFGLRRLDGSPVWDGKDHPPPGADPLAGTVIGVRGRYLLAEWRPQGSVGATGVGNVRPTIIAVHDVRTGDVIAASPSIDRRSDDTAPGITLSADERYLTVGRAAFDLRVNRALEPLPSMMVVGSIGPNGIAYGTGNDFRPVAYDLVNRTVVWESAERTALPAAMTDNALVFELGDSAATVVGFATAR